MKPTTYVVGIDPGFGMSGLVLRREDQRDTLAWALYQLGPERTKCGVLRSLSLSEAIIWKVADWIEEFEIKRLEVCIEEPVYNHNARTLMLQCRLLEDIEHGLFMYIAAQTEQLYLTEVNPRTSKRLLAHNGQANKQAMIAASPWAEYKKMGIPNQQQAETLADAYAHSLAAGQEVYDLTAMRMIAVDATNEWSDNDE